MKASLSFMLFAAAVFSALAETLPSEITWEEPAPGLDYGRIYWYVPKRLDLSKKPGLFIFMHGGGAERNVQPLSYLLAESKSLVPQIDELTCVTAAATAPRGRGDHWRWNHPDAEAEVLAIIDAAEKKFGIDRDRVILGGQSMGGFGAYHLGQVLADRLAGVWAAAGAWCTADFRSMRGTPMFIQHGILDCAPGFSNEPEPRKQFQTGYSFALAAHEVMTRDGVEHVFSPYSGGHGLKFPDAQKSTARFVAWANGLRRQPYAPAVTVVTPCGAEKPCFDRRTRSRWLEVTGTVPGTVELDTVELSDCAPAYDWTRFAAQTYRLAKKRLVGFRLEAFNRGGNRFEVKAENVTAFRIHIAPQMGDLGRPFTVDAGPLGVQTLKAVPESGEKDYSAVLTFTAEPKAVPVAKVVSVKPRATDTVLDNPGMGIVLYRQDGNMWTYEPSLAPSDTFDWFPGANVVCCRLPWKTLMPAEGEVRWDLVDTFVRPWAAKGRRFALGIVGKDVPDAFVAKFAARFAGDPDLAFVQVDADVPRWEKSMPGVVVLTADGARGPVLHLPKICRETVLPRNWKAKDLLDEVEKTRTSYFGLSGFPEVCYRNNELLFPAVARRIGYRFELRELRYPDVVEVGSPVRIESTWVNVGVADCSFPAFVTYALVDENGQVAWTWTDEALDLRKAAPTIRGVERPLSGVSDCRFGAVCAVPEKEDPTTEKARELYYLGHETSLVLLKPGEYMLAVSVGRASGRPEIALPLQDGLGLTYPVGKVRVVAPTEEKDPRVAETVCEFTRDEKPEGLSGVSHITGNRYYCVDDRGGMLYEMEIALNGSEDDGTCKVIRSVALEGRVDLEGCAYDPLDGRVWVSDESDHSIRQFDPKDGRETAQIEIPEVFLKNMRKNRSFEALALSPDGLRLYAANEDTLVCDGTVSGKERGGRVRIQEFARKGAGDAWRAARQWTYQTEKISGEAFGGLAISGVVSLCAPGDGTLIVLEREMSQKNPLFPSFHGRLFEISLSDDARPVVKRPVWDEDTMFSNYEGFCFGPNLKSGMRSLVLVSDGGGEAEERIQVLSVRY